jgi:REP element-mobilizing transposase RayT
LTADVAEILHGTVPQVCISYGWWLEFLEVMADCLHWVAVLPPTEAVADHVQTVRRVTSAYLFEAFPEYSQENFSKDFWAPGFSVRAGAQRHSKQEINSYVLNYRIPWRRYARKPPFDSDRSSESRPD